MIILTFTKCISSNRDFLETENETETDVNSLERTFASILLYYIVLMYFKLYKLRAPFNYYWASPTFVHFTTLYEVSKNVRSERIKHYRSQLFQKLVLSVNRIFSLWVLTFTDSNVINKYLLKLFSIFQVFLSAS